MLQNAKPISNKTLKNFEKKASKNAVLTVAAHAMNKSPLTKVATVMPQQGNTDFHFSVQINTMAVTNQKRSGRCWIFAALNLLREQVGKQCNIKDFELSQNYTAFWDKFEKSNWFLESVIDLADQPVTERTLHWVLQNGIQDGGQWDMIVSLIEKYGVVPKAAMPETAVSGDTPQLNQLLQYRLAKAATKIRRQKAEGKDLEALAKIKEDAMQDVYNMLASALGTPPASFNFEYTDKDDAYHIENGLTPLSFYKKYTNADLTDYISVINAPTADKPYYQSYTVDYLGNVVNGQPIQYLNLPMEDMEKLIVKELQSGLPVWFGSDVSHFGDREEGVWDDASFDYDSLFDTKFFVSKEDMLDYGLSAMNHAMLLTGVNLNADKAPTKWKVENSWSEKSGNKGYFIMSESWFERFVYQAVVHKNILTAKQARALEKPVVHLNPWDPMGTLAQCK